MMVEDHETTPEDKTLLPPSSPRYVLIVVSSLIVWSKPTSAKYVSRSVSRVSERTMLELKSRLVETELSPSVDSSQSMNNPSNAILFTRKVDSTLDDVFAVFDNSDTESTADHKFRKVQ